MVNNMQQQDISIMDNQQQQQNYNNQGSNFNNFNQYQQNLPPIGSNDFQTPKMANQMGQYSGQQNIIGSP